MTYFAEHAWLGDTTGRYDAEGAPAAAGFADDVLIHVEDGRFVEVTAGVTDVPSRAVRLRGLVLPGLANTHSHAFHRALRGRTHAGRGSFWTWRDRMYAVAGRLDPDSYLALARAVYAEMALAGVTCVGEFHYLHHDPNGHSYHDANAMGRALIVAAAEAGIRITLLDTLYLSSAVDGAALTPVQRRFGDDDLDGWSGRTDRLIAELGTTVRGGPGSGDLGGHCIVGAALHSVRAVPARYLTAFADRTAGRPVHIHLSEQRAENEQCLAVHGCTPTELLHRTGVLGPRTTAVHATHLTPGDVKALGATGTGVCLCPTTERDLADGVPQARALADAGSPLSVGSDSHAVIDLFEEIRGVELHERLVTERRGHFDAGELLTAASATGHAALGWTDAGVIAAGARADLVAVRLDSVRTAGVDPAGAVFAATAADVSHVIADGRTIVADGHHVRLDVAHALHHSLLEIP